MAGSLIEGGEVKSLLSRKITEETCRHFGYRIAEHKGSSVQVAPYYNADGNLVAQKLRGQDKKFSVLGSLDEALPFGSHAFPKSGRAVVVTEGEVDALSMSQVQGNKWPVVSIPNGAQGAKKHVAKCLDYYKGFEKVVLMFDQDEPGRKAAKECAEVLGRRAHIAELPLKDANEMLKAGRTEELVKAFWGAKQWAPEGIVDMASLKEKVKEPPKLGLSWWTPQLTKATYGIRLGEIHAFGAGTGVGKTDFFTQQMCSMVAAGERIGVFALEQTVVDTARRIAGKQAGKTFHIPDSGWTEADIDSAWEKLTGTGKVFLYDSFGVNEWPSVKQQIEYLAHSEGVKYIFLDHLTALAAAEENEKEALERIMSDMGSMVAKLQITVFLVSHLATPEGKPHEEGGRVTIRHFKGSRAIGFWSHFMYGLERNQQAEDEGERHTTCLRILKDRYTGRSVGQCIWLGYEKDTGLLYETVAPGQQDEMRKPEEVSDGAPSDF